MQNCSVEKKPYKSQLIKKQIPSTLVIPVLHYPRNLLNLFIKKKNKTTVKLEPAGLLLRLEGVAVVIVVEAAKRVN